MTYPILQHKFSNIQVDENTDVVVEIGNSVESAKFLAAWSESKNLPFYSIDIDKLTAYKLKVKNIKANIEVQLGHEWCRDTLPYLDKKIKILCLNSFPKPGYVYEENGIEVTEENIMKGHRLLIQYCLPYMAQESIIFMGDTYYDPMIIDLAPEQFQNWGGACATAIQLMIDAEYTIVRNQEYNINYAIRPRQLNQ